MKLFLILLISMSIYANELKIKANSFESDQKKGISIFSGDVNIIRENDEINASKITVYTNTKNEPTKYLAEGNVSFHITTQEGAQYKGRSQKVIYVPLSKEYLFYENVHIKQLGEKNEIIGDEVVVKTVEGKAKAKSNTKNPVIMIFDIKENNESKK
ncbi:lipopolysaccharide transport periplasmic protein LptA [Sulfurimonas lithotrophica]|uniref:Lipopolysaccharide transport periplasmic protein LptA n=1 Tax=Sulfurimonas lithotrophica TaxID=2590022 RepID=A0A5P8P0T0_9BACT|nr:lipopolysaccharide transport periplasmic protein LptA [Sulfurimonas lithotrophica]QFR49274.1 lipopolysaccharide transport periplasmic protein LptA [Sulfurimonas lithotrophica]